MDNLGWNKMNYFFQKLSISDVSRVLTWRGKSDQLLKIIFNKKYLTTFLLTYQSSFVSFYRKKEWFIERKRSSGEKLL